MKSRRIRKSIQEIQAYFWEVLGEISIDEILRNRELGIRAELVESLLSRVKA